jgi:hypothetical protein
MAVRDLKSEYRPELGSRVSEGIQVLANEF